MGLIVEHKDLKIGEKYKKSDLGITKGRQMSEFIVGGEEFYVFFSINSPEYHNKIDYDGFIYEGRAPYALIQVGKKVELHRHIFVKEVKGSCYTYFGKGKYESRYDNTRNKIFW